MLKPRAAVRGASDGEAGGGMGASRNAPTLVYEERGAYARGSASPTPSLRPGIADVETYLRPVFRTAPRRPHRVPCRPLPPLMTRGRRVSLMVERVRRPAPYSTRLHVLRRRRTIPCGSARGIRPTSSCEREHRRVRCRLGATEP
jgi:hypothetical protein